MTIGKHIFFWVILLILQFILIMSYSTPGDIYKVIEEERSSLVEVLGDDGRDNIVLKAEGLMKTSIIESGALDMSYSLFAPEVDADKESMSYIIREKIEVFWASVYQIIQRVLIIFFWAKYFLILFIPAVVTGFVKRKINTYELGWSSPVRYHASMHGIVALLFIPSLYLSVPISISPLVVVGWLVASSIVISTFVANIQKRL